jgi:hypothetical protein
MTVVEMIVPGGLPPRRKTPRHDEKLAAGQNRLAARGCRHHDFSYLNN